MPTDERLDDATRMTQMLGGFQISQALYVVAKLDVATALADVPLDVHELAERCGAAPGPLGRLIRRLAPLGVFATDGDGRVAVTPLGATLGADHPNSLRAAALCTGWRPTTSPSASSCTPPGPASRPLPTCSVGPSSTGSSPIRSGPSCRAGAWPACRPVGTVADIGGADGWLLAAVLGAHPDRQGIVFDLPAIVASAGPLIEQRGLAGRMEAVGGDFFDRVPAADLYVAAHVLHDWDDDSCRRILSSIAEAAPSGARLLVIEGIIALGDGPNLYK